MRAALILIALAPALGGCVASMAASAVGAVVRAADSGERQVIVQDRRPAARAACSARAAEHGAVTIIDVEQMETGRVTVWGTVQAGQARRSFECGYDTRVASFRLRDIRPAN